MPGGLPGGGGMLKLRFDRYITSMSMFFVRPNFLWLLKSWKTDKDPSTRSKRHDQYLFDNSETKINETL